MQNNTVERIVDVPVSQIHEKIVGVIHLILQERISERIEAKLASRIQEELLEVIQLIRRTRISERIVETFTDASVPQIQERLVEGNTFNKYTSASRTEKTSQRQSLEENTLCTLRLSSARDHLQTLRSGRRPSRKRVLGVVLSRT